MVIISPWGMKLYCLVFYYSLIYVFSVSASSEFYGLRHFELTSYDLIRMQKYEGKVLMIVNVASQCGFTDSHYKELRSLKEKYREEDFEILAFPCNQFGEQEPGSTEYIFKYVKENYQINFPFFVKIDTIGEQQHPIYKWLVKETGREPNWNFCKYLLDKKGNVVRFASPGITPFNMENDIKNLLGNHSLKGDIFAYEYEGRKPNEELYEDIEEEEDEPTHEEL